MQVKIDLAWLRIVVMKSLFRSACKFCYFKSEQQQLDLRLDLIVFIQSWLSGQACYAIKIAIDKWPAWKLKKASTSTLGKIVFKGKLAAVGHE